MTEVVNSIIHKQGLVVFIDDNFINHQSMQMQFQEFGIEDKLIMYQDGPSAVQFFKKMLSSQLLSKPTSASIQPI